MIAGPPKSAHSWLPSMRIQSKLPLIHRRVTEHLGFAAEQDRLRFDIPFTEHRAGD
jgi:hypothetical protein